MDDLKKLAKLVYDSVEEIEKSCKARNVTFPSLSDLYSPESEIARKDPAVLYASGNIVAAAGQLIALARPTPLSLHVKSIQFHVSSAIGYAVEANIADILRPAGPAGVHVDKIAQEAGVNPNKLARCLRLLVSEHIFTEVRKDVFANNRLSSMLATGKGIAELLAKPEDRFDGTNGVAAFMTHNYKETFKGSAYMAENLMDPKCAHAFDVTKTPFNTAYKTDLPLFDWYELPENKRALKTFGHAMWGTANLAPPDSLYESFDWANLPAGSKFVDVGGGVGTQALALARVFPHLKYVVQDRPDVIPQGKEHWATTLPDAYEKGLVEFQATDFFKEQPVTDASVFFLRQIIHDWPDEQAIQILKVLRAAASPNTHLLHNGFVLSYASPDSFEPENKLPEPLLPNGGHGNILDYLTDLQMLVLVHGQERTLEQLNFLFEQSGWKVSKVMKGRYFTGGYQFVDAIPA